MSGENELKCNNLKCRKGLASDGRAVVTNCSHIFCMPCAEVLFKPDRLCPACEIQLTEADDIVVCSLAPTTDYKSSILAGLSPSVIMEIATRAMNFWTYQTSQESSFQTMVLKNAKDRLMAVERQMTMINEELKGANLKNASLVTEVEELNRKVREILEQLQKRYLLGGSAAAVANAVNEEVQSYENQPPMLQITRYQGHNPGPARSRPIATPNVKSHQPHAFVPGSAQKSDHGQYLHQFQSQTHRDYHKVTPEDSSAHHHIQEIQRGSPGGLILDRYSYSNANGPEEPHQQQQQAHPYKRPFISPEPRALLTNIPATQIHSARQPLASMSGNTRHNYSEKSPAAQQGKSHTELRALNDSGFGMKAPLQQLNNPVNHAQRQMHSLSANSRQTERIIAANSGNYGDRLMAMQARLPQGGRGPANGEKSLRKIVQPRTSM
ncbi:hypothetical protein NliqN6_3321 [Naganishia liquefaciens]|uniref:RING-type domain-containing protein n=1 Tax=Naganishia liquefaciens TaxID=104408 RepID=A0A8H3YEW1_9TREE|nr:hypothetical protein NliqN6_3321 [Naganishia liquefaciens]